LPVAAHNTSIQGVLLSSRHFSDARVLKGHLHAPRSGPGHDRHRLACQQDDGTRTETMLSATKQEVSFLDLWTHLVCDALDQTAARNPAVPGSLGHGMRET
jgi:hypothetical protein